MLQCTQQQSKQQFAYIAAVAEVPPMLRMPKDTFQKEKKKLCFFHYSPLHRENRFSKNNGH